MTNVKLARRAFVTSLVSMLLCFSMLMGTTFAWFTDSVTSEDNIIKSGTLKVTMEYTDDLNGTWTDASTGKMFNYQYWEPGYSEVKYIKITNAGDLAFKFRLDIIPSMLPAAGEPNLADVIDVYMLNPVTSAIDANTAMESVGTLSSLMSEKDGAAHGILLPDAAKGSVDADAMKKSLNLTDAQLAAIPAGEIIVALKLTMKDNAGNEYQDLTVGDGFSVRLMATQVEAEADSFGTDYDASSKYDGAPIANVTRANVPSANATLGMGGTAQSFDIDAAFRFNTTDDLSEAKASSYKYWHADFVVYADRTVPADSMALLGYYSAYCDDYNNGNWVALTSDADIAANQEIRLLELMLGGGSMSYQELCQYVPEFLCGVADLDGKNCGTTLTVELRLYEVEENTPSTSAETGKYETIGVYSYTWDLPEEPENTSKVSEGLYIDANGTYYITNATGLETMRSSVETTEGTVNDGVWVLYDNVDLGGIDWTPINNFHGTFDGNGKFIANLTVNGGDGVGLFGVNAQNGDGFIVPTIKNLTLKAPVVTGGAKVGAVVGGVAAVVMNDVHVVGATVTGAEYVGGIIGYAYGAGGVTITGCSVTDSTVKNTDGTQDGKVGGIGGYLTLGTIDSCSVSGTTVSGYKCVGGIVGRGGNAGDDLTLTLTSNVVENNTLGAATGTPGAMVGESLKVVIQ